MGVGDGDMPGAAAPGPSGGATSALIESDRVAGTAVRRPNGETVGHIERLMIGKRDGRVAYAVMGFGGFLGMGQNHYTLPWEILTYDTTLDGFVLDLSDEQLKGAPVLTERGTDPSSEPDWEEHVHRYFNTRAHPGEDVASASHEAKP